MENREESKMNKVGRYKSFYSDCLGLSINSNYIICHYNV